MPPWGAAIPSRSFSWTSSEMAAFGLVWVEKRKKVLSAKGSSNPSLYSSISIAFALSRVWTCWAVSCGFVPFSWALCKPCIGLLGLVWVFPFLVSNANLPFSLWDSMVSFLFVWFSCCSIGVVWGLGFWDPNLSIPGFFGICPFWATFLLNLPPLAISISQMLL